MALKFNPKTLFLEEIGVALDPHRPMPFAFVSHGHADHFARHEKVLASVGTAEILVKRYGIEAGSIQRMEWGEKIEIEGHEIELFPAGHISGSAMIRIEKEGHSLLYTGDFKTRPSRTAEAPVFPKAEVLIMETTFGLPRFVFPPTEETERQITRFVMDALSEGETPILFAYSLGKAQEALAILAEAKIPVVVTKPVFEMTEVVRSLGWDLPEPVLLGKSPPEGAAVVAPPNAVRSRLIRNLKKKQTAMLSGWALTPGSKFRYQVDDVFPLSDHADFPGLIEAVEKVSPSLVYTLHGSTRQFAAELRSRGTEAWSIYGDDQLELLETAGGEVREVKSQVRPECDLKELSELFVMLMETPSRLKKVRRISDFLRTLGEEDLGRVLTWLGGGAVHQLGSAIIKQALLDGTGTPVARYKATSANQNDAARTARLILEDAELEPEAVSFAMLDEVFEELNESQGTLEKTRVLAEWFRRVHPREGETLVRLLSEGLRIGAKEGLYEEAIAEAFESPIKAVRHATMLSASLAEVARAAKAGRLEEIELRPGVALKPMLAAPTETSEEIIGWHDSGEVPLWLEPKYDGIRAQLHVTGKGAHLFSRDQRSLDGEFPEILEAAGGLPQCILDGELIAFAEGKKLTFFDLQKRLGRKQMQGDLFFGASIPVKFVAFDCLFYEGSLLEKHLGERRAALEGLSLEAPFEAISVERPAGDDLGALEAGFKQAIAEGNEGLIAKVPDSLYQPGRRGKAWRKLKGVMPTLDCVVIKAQQGHGKRAGVLSDYTFAVRDEKSGELRTLGKAYSGLTDVEIEELTDHFEKTTVAKISSRVREVTPEVILEIAFDKIRPSKRHDSGLALRFPRIKAIRRDKKLEEIDTLQTAQRLLD